jgi:PAP2 superfamily protein
MHNPVSAETFGRLVPSEFHTGESSCHTDASLEAAIAWRIFRFNWRLLAAALGAFDLCLLLTDFRIQPKGYLIVLGAASVYGLAGYGNAMSQRRKPWVFSMLTALAQVMLTVSILISMTYIVTAANFPLRDSTLLAVDRAMGFDFRAFLNFVNDRNWLIYILAAGYRSISLPIWLVMIVLPLAGYFRHAAESVRASSSP